MTGVLRSHWTQAGLLALAAAIVHTWPLATDPAGLSLHYNSDVMLNEWIITWIQHQLPRNPLTLFDGNIFYPARNTLAFSEPLIVPALLGSPVRMLGGSPVLVHNLLLLAGLTLSVLAGYALAFRWTGDRAAGLLAGFVFTFNPQTLMRIEHLQAVHAYGLPLSLLATDALLARGRRGHAVWLGLLLALMAYTSGYLVVFALAANGVLVLARLRRLGDRAVATGSLLAAALAGVLVLPLYLQYREAAVEQQMRRTVDSVYQFSATPDGFLASYSRLHGWLWNAGAAREFPDAYFPGIVVLGLALAGLVRAGWTRADRTRIVATAAMAILGGVLALGTRTPLYAWVYDYVPLVSSLRAAGRFGILFLLGIGVLAAFGLAVLRQRLGWGPLRAAVTIGVLLAVNAEQLRAPLAFTPYRGIPRPYALLADDPGPVVLVEVPFHLPETIFMNGEYVFNSTAHWRPLMNGYSGYTPASYREYVKSFWDFPDPRAVESMRAAGATHLMLHPRQYGPYAGETLEAALANPRLERLAVGRDEITLFRIR
jgi:hypothetical protein